MAPKRMHYPTEAQNIVRKRLQNVQYVVKYER